MSAIDKAIKELSALHSDNLLHKAAQKERYALDGRPGSIVEQVWPGHAAGWRATAKAEATRMFDRALAADEAARA